MTQGGGVVPPQRQIPLDNWHPGKPNHHPNKPQPNNSQRTMGLPRKYYTYIVASRSRVLYIGMTNNLERRMREHKHGKGAQFTKRYNVHRLVWYETFRRPQEAVAREKELKGWLRERKIALIESVNPSWEDLSAIDPAKG
jgi:putative endonuclease